MSDKETTSIRILPWIIISLLVSTMFIYRECSRPVKIDYLPGDTITKTDTIKGDSIPVPYPVVEIKKEDSIAYVEVPAQIDSAAIAKDYFAKRFYSPVIIDDSLLYVRIEAMVSENRLKWVVPYRQIRRPQIVNHYTTYQYLPAQNKRFKIKPGAIGYVSPLNSDFAVSLKTEINRFEVSYGYGLFGGSHIVGVWYSF